MYTAREGGHTTFKKKQHYKKKCVLSAFTGTLLVSLAAIFSVVTQHWTLKKTAARETTR